MEQLKKILNQAAEEWGVCHFEQLTLLQAGSKKRLPQNPQSMIVLLFGYYTEEYPDRNISRYAIADDYHTVLLPKLQGLARLLKEAYPKESFVPFIDASPIPEVRAAYLAGLGDVGKNGQLLNRRYGSYCFIGEIVTTLKLPAGEPVQGKLCTGCGRCIAACPSGALTDAGFQKEKCRSHITQKKGVLEEWERREIQAGGLAWGCDCCVDSCPVNRFAQKSQVPEFYENRVPVLTLDNLQPLCDVKAYGWRGQQVLSRNLSFLDFSKNDG